MYAPSRIVPILIIVALLIVSAGCTGTNNDLIRPVQTPSAGTASSGTTSHAAAVDFRNNAERQAFFANFDTLAEKEMNAWGVPGMTVAVVKDGKIVYAKGYGVKKAGGSDPVTADTVFQIGSTSKAFTSALVAMEVDSGRMKWDDKVTTYVPDFQMNDPWVTKEFTITDSLAQRSGLPDHWGTELGGLGYSRDEMIHALRYVEPVTSFRSTYMYQNAPFLVAAKAVENTSKKSWEDNVRERIFVPLDMKSASTGQDAFMASPDRVSLHWNDLRDDDTYGPVVADSSPYMIFTTAMAPAGGINANVKDMGNWAIFQLGNGTWNGNRLMSTENLDYLHTPRTPVSMVANATKDYYCQAWLYEEVPGYPPVIWHNGETYGNHAMIFLVPSKNLGIVVLSNVAGPSLPDSLAWKFYNRYLGRPDSPGLAGAAAGYRQSVNLTASAFVLPVKENATPALPLSAYTGTYRNDIYGTATVAEQDGNLTVTYGKLSTVYYLTHYDGNDFYARCPSYQKSYIDGVTFQPGPDGAIQKMVLPMMLRPGVYETFVRA
ncbi:MAG: serine hydrolase [Methanoregula sp.]|nr:serine hydrolase [Methanoregula sp.]